MNWWERLRREASRPESTQRYLWLCQGLGLVSLVKLWPQFPLHQHAPGMLWPCLAVALLCSLALVLKRWVRASAALLSLFYAAGFFGLLGPLPHEGLRSHHVQLLLYSLWAVCLMGLPRGPHVRGIGLKFLRFAMLQVYLFAVLIKLSPWYLSGQQLQQLYHGLYGSSDPVSWALFPALAQALSLAALIVEALILVGLLVARLRRPAVGLAVLFHALLFLVLPVSIFSALMCLNLCALFLPGPLPEDN